MVFFILYLQRRKIAALIEGVIVAMGCRWLANLWWWLEDFFSGDGADADDLPELVGLEQPEGGDNNDNGNDHIGSGTAIGRRAGRRKKSKHRTGSGGGGGGEKGENDSGSGDQVEDEQLTMGLRIDPSTRERWRAEARESAESLAVFEALRPQVRLESLKPVTVGATLALA